MILINLLPHRQVKRRQRRQLFFVLTFIAAMIGLLLVAMWYGWNQRLLTKQLETNLLLQQGITKLDEQIKDVVQLKSEIVALKARQKSVEDLQTDRNMPVHLLNELVRQTPPGIFLKKMKYEGNMVMLEGIAQTNERVSELLRNTANNSAWFERPELQEIKSVTTKLKDTATDKRLFAFSMSLVLKRPVAADAAASAASAAATTSSSASLPNVN